MFLARFQARFIGVELSKKALKKSLYEYAYEGKMEQQLGSGSRLIESLNNPERAKKHSVEGKRNTRYRIFPVQ